METQNIYVSTDTVQPNEVESNVNSPKKQMKKKPSPDFFERLSKAETFSSSDRKKRIGTANKIVTPSTTPSTNSSISTSISRPKTPSRRKTPGRGNIFDRLNQADTFSSADKKEKSTKKNVARTTKHVAPLRQRPLNTKEIMPSTSTIGSENHISPRKEKNKKTSNLRPKSVGSENLISPQQEKNKKTSDLISKSVGSENPISPRQEKNRKMSNVRPKRHPSNTKQRSLSRNSRSSRDQKHFSSKEMVSLLSPERIAISELQQRIKSNLSPSECSISSDITTQATNKSFDLEHMEPPLERLENIEDDDDEYDNIDEGDDTLFKLILKRDFDRAEAFLNNIQLSFREMRDALYYQNKDGWNSLMWALYQKSPKSITAPDSLIRQMVEIGEKELLLMTDSWGNNALMYAVKYKRPIEITDLFLAVGGGKEYVMQKNFKGKSVLHFACETNASLDLIKSLAEAGGEELVLIKDNDGAYARSKSDDVMSYLRKVDKIQEKELTPMKRPIVLYKMIESNEFEQAESFLQDQNLNLYGKRNALAYQNKDGWTPLMKALVTNAPDSLIKTMVAVGGAEVISTKNKFENVALLYALGGKRSFEIVKLIIDRSLGVTEEGDIARRYGKGLSPLHWACKHCGENLEIIQYLVQEGGKYSAQTGTKVFVSITNFANELPLHYACAYGASLDVIRCLIDAGGNELLSIHDKNGKLALHVACEKKAKFEVIKYLTDHGGKEPLLRKDSDGKVPLHWSCEKGASLNVIKYLAQVGGQESLKKIPFLVKKSVHRGVLLSGEYD
mmetsp:Transcript_338/g.470  ORF Transcript_338/g.470 Transcript_338/m.470 type:complete len:788 (-) Transcript_338:638-3001(-)